MTAWNPCLERVANELDVGWPEVTSRSETVTTFLAWIPCPSPGPVAANKKFGTTPRRRVLRVLMGDLTNEANRPRLHRGGRRSQESGKLRENRG